MKLPEWAKEWGWSKDDNEQKAMHDLIDRLKPSTVFEWGCGVSSIVFPMQHECIRHWIAVEHDETWANRIKFIAGKLGLKKLDMRLRDVRRGDYHLELSEYISSLSIIPDLIFVDGRERTLCLKESARLLPWVPCLLHDFNRSRYIPGIDMYEKKEVLTPPICGSVGNDREKSFDGKYWHKGLLLLTEGERKNDA